MARDDSRITKTKAPLIDPRRDSTRFYVRAGSVNAVRRALYRAPGGARVVGRFDRDTIECQHTMDGHSYRRHWPVIASRLEKAGLVVVARHGFGAGEDPIPQDLPRDSPRREFEDNDDSSVLLMVSRSRPRRPLPRW